MTAITPISDQALLEHLDVVIPVRVTHSARQRNLAAVVRWLSTHSPAARILIAEQDTSAKVRLPRSSSDRVVGGIEHVLVADGGAFDKGWTLNCGAQKTRRPFIAFVDADVAVAPTQFLAALRLLARFDAVKPYHRAQVIDLDGNESDHFARSARVGGLTGVNRRGMTNFAGGMFLMRREAFFEVGGFPEGFCGWGGEDDAMGIIVERLTRHAEVPGPCIHLDHPPMCTTNDPSYLQNVQRLVEVARASTAQLQKWSLVRRLTMGDPNRLPGERWRAMPLESA